MKKTLLVLALSVLFWAAALTGWVMCIIKFASSDFKPTYEREIIYGVGMCTGIGAIVGYLNIPDRPTESTKK